VEDAVSIARTAPWKGTPAGRGPDPAEAETRLEPHGAAVAARRAERRRLARRAGIAALGLIIASGAAFLAAQRRADSRADTATPASVALTPEYPGPTIRYGVIPFVTEEIVRREMDPLVRYLSRKLERRVTLVVGRNYDDITEGVVTGRLHAAQLAPLQYVRARARESRVRMLALQTYEGSRSYEGYLVARDDSPVEQASDLAGKRICYVESGSASGWLLPRAFLRRNHLDPDRLFADQRMSGDHVSVMRDVLEGRCDAGAVYSGALLAGRDLGLPVGRLRVVAVTGRLPYDATVASPSFGDADAGRLRQALISLDVRSEFGVTVLGKTLRIGGYIAGDDALFDPVRQALESEEVASNSGAAPDAGSR
jgi:phosphonate transport system substrate-binding protein